MRKILLLLILVLLVCAPVRAQVLQDSVLITVYDQSSLGLVIEPTGVIAFVGDTVTFSAVAIDQSTGDTIPTIVTWSSPDTTIIQIDPSTGLATFVGSGYANLLVDAQVITSLAFSAVIVRGGEVVDSVDLGRVYLGQTYVRPPRSWWRTMLATLFAPSN